ncbi:YgaC family protein [Klebsiella sp. WP4-W18-ESBL-05]|uniref:YgaC family protein n=1 Tax=Klebsiella sp. WP4-W18-ESBL-05 TaxID=2675713 RepID=UPI001D10BACD|nr:YgaC family protein [Klebsiella sp. WP4-W18-ESBL-05]
MLTRKSVILQGDQRIEYMTEARMGRTALIIHPGLKDRSYKFAEPASDIKACDHYEQFPLYLGGDVEQHYGIPHGFSSRMALERFLDGLFGENV